MTTLALYPPLHFLLCLLLFAVVQRPLFMWVHGRGPAGLRRADIPGIYRAGLKTDMAACAYLTGPALIATAVCAFCGWRPAPALWVCEAVVALAAALATVADIALYTYWQAKIDASVLGYLRYIGGAFASVTATYAALAVGSVLLLAGALYAALMGLVMLCGAGEAATPPGLWGVLSAAGVFLLYAAALFACIRGLAHRPKSPAVACHSPRPLPNHCALNPVYNVLYTLSLRQKGGKPFARIPAEECRAELARLFPAPTGFTSPTESTDFTNPSNSTNSATPTRSLLRTSRPNVLVIVWESLCEHFVEAIGGKPGVTPELCRLCDEGVLFTNVVAGSVRTDPALVCLLSGMPGQPTANVIRQDKILHRLPALPRTLRSQGYTTHLYHGGSLNYMNFVGYFIASGHDSLTSRPDLPADAPACSWGVHDGFMCDLLYDRITGPLAAEQPWYATFLTLSSHQPYKVPYARLDDEMDNAFAYTDHCLGRLVSRLKQTPQWQDLLIVVTGDHGINETSLGMTRAQSTHVPLLLLGGAVREPARIDTLMCQTDIAATLLAQMGIDHSDFPFSRDVLAPTYTYPFAMHVHTGGFTYTDATGSTDYDTAASRATAGADPERERKGMAILQGVYDDIARRSVF